MHRLSGGMYVTGTSRWLKTDPDVQTAHVRLTDPDTQIVWRSVHGTSGQLKGSRQIETNTKTKENWMTVGEQLVS